MKGKLVPEYIAKLAAVNSEVGYSYGVHLNCEFSDESLYKMFCVYIELVFTRLQLSQTQTNFHWTTQRLLSEG